MFDFIIFLVLGAAFCIIGWRIWKHEQLTLIHRYHYKKVSKKDRKAYAEKMGKACIVIGIGLALCGLINYITVSSIGWLCFVVCFVFGFTMILMAQKRYNGGLF
ncbi:DUF3784 domain-containing protein [Fusibacter paucivorans]|uniref:DUF3784 domain-containing protein n=1 Tax=Fusibacter paucivorans TaxID=76009 RepID=A0ABS5PQU5_9FIRM|nr:DUF3784 domain-containing protein [Fusibacter paucivorans]MBS7526789.1 DUF3784 domain-containing protein [Fusibacter paucivorans]